MPEQASQPTAPVPVQVPERSHFEVTEPAGTAVLTYSLDEDETGRTVTLEHTLVPSELEGRGVGTALIRAALAWAAQDGRAVVPRCPFVQAFLRRHPHEVPGPVRPV